jgi:hypothetical protein
MAHMQMFIPHAFSSLLPYHVLLEKIVISEDDFYKKTQKCIFVLSSVADIFKCNEPTDIADT